MNPENVMLSKSKENWLINSFPDLSSIVAMPLQHSIGIDGDPGSGKSFLGSHIAKITNRKLISIDDFILGNGSSYTAQVNNDLILNEIQKHGKSIIIEGIHLLEVIETNNIKIDYIIFCKAFANGEWIFCPFNKFKPKSKLTHDLMDYYNKYMPHKKSNFVINSIIDKNHD